ncbi:MAG: hypothetical protein V3U46_02590 [Acidimicrobiia bacterium]
MRSPDYMGGGLVNLSAELEQRLGGGSASPGLTSELAAQIPNAETYVLVLFDGLGDLQIASHAAAADLKEHRAGLSMRRSLLKHRWRQPRSPRDSRLRATVLSLT